MYEFKEYKQQINAKFGTDFPDTGFEMYSDAKLTAINFGGTPNLDEQMTVVCSGAARGGSSILPYLLHNMGIPMGTFEADNYEDIEMLRNRHSIDKLSKVIEKRNAENEIYGFKIPSLRRQQFGYFDDALRNPVFMYIMRNPALAAQSVVKRANNENFSNDRKGYSNAIQGAVQSYLEFIAFMRQTKSPCIFIAMEALHKDPLPCVTKIAELLQISVPEEKLAELAQEVQTPGYKSRNN